jgi:hypothetical protein
MPVITLGSDISRRKVTSASREPDDRDRDRRLRITAGADNTGGAAEHEHHQQRPHQTDSAECNLERAEHLDMNVHGTGFYTVQFDSRCGLTCASGGDHRFNVRAT